MAAIVQEYVIPSVAVSVNLAMIVAPVRSVWEASRAQRLKGPVPFANLHSSWESLDEMPRGGAQRRPAELVEEAVDAAEVWAADIVLALHIVPQTSIAAGNGQACTADTPVHVWAMHASMHALTI